MLTNDAEAFLSARTLSEIADLAIDDLERQCLGQGEQLAASMADWVKVEVSRIDGSHRLCAVCLGGATLVSRGWIRPGDAELLTEIRQRGADTVVSEHTGEDVFVRVCALDRIRELNVADAMETAFEGDLDTEDQEARRALCDRLDKDLTRESADNRLDPERLRRYGTNHLAEKRKLSTAEVTESIRFFRKVVIPRLRKAGL
ncbi:MAG: hypothetical protein OXG35_33900 [Acidobacteria bacterium]|nr:hypothetical protein [Acidobacteriota bacterium]